MKPWRPLGGRAVAERETGAIPDRSAKGHPGKGSIVPSAQMPGNLPQSRGVDAGLRVAGYVCTIAIAVWSVTGSVTVALCLGCAIGVLAGELQEVFLWEFASEFPENGDPGK